MRWYDIVALAIYAAVPLLTIGTHGCIAIRMRRAGLMHRHCVSILVLLGLSLVSSTLLPVLGVLTVVPYSLVAEHIFRIAKESATSVLTATVYTAIGCLHASSRVWVNKSVCHISPLMFLTPTVIAFFGLVFVNALVLIIEEGIRQKLEGFVTHDSNLPENKRYKNADFRSSRDQQTSLVDFMRESVQEAMEQILLKGKN